MYLKYVSICILIIQSFFVRKSFISKWKLFVAFLTFVHIRKENSYSTESRRHADEFDVEDEKREADLVFLIARIDNNKNTTYACKTSLLYA